MKRVLFLSLTSIGAFVMLVDAALPDGSQTMQLLSSDFLFMDALLLFWWRHPSLKAWMPLAASVPVIAILMRMAAQLAGIRLCLDPVLYTTVFSGLLLLAAASTEVIPLLRSGRFVAVLQARGKQVIVKLALAQCLTFLGMVILFFRYIRPGRPMLVASVAVIVLLAACYAYIMTHCLRKAPSRNKVQETVPDVSVQDLKRPESRDDRLFARAESYMREKRPYLNDEFSLSDLASEMATNKTTMSRVVNDKSGRNFCQYVNAYRVRHAVSLMDRDHRLKVNEVAIQSGFHSIVSFNMAFRLVMCVTPSEYMQSLRAAALKQQRRPSDVMQSPQPEATKQEGER